MPTTIEVVHYFFDEKTVYCGYLVAPPSCEFNGRQIERKILLTTKSIHKVTCLKCAKLLSIGEGHITRRKNKAIFRKLHIKRRDSQVQGLFLSFCGQDISAENLEHVELRVCRNCKKNLNGGTV